MYVVFEGTNGVGKSTQLPLVISLLNKYFKEYGEDIKINSYHEGDTCKKEYDNFYEEVLDYARDRAKCQKMTFGEGFASITIADRSYYSSLVYQGYGDINYIRNVNKFVEEPELIFLFENNAYDYNTKLYLDILPYSKTTPIHTKYQPIEKTTSVIADTIFLYWLDEYSDELEPYSVFDKIKKAVNEKETEVKK